MNNEAGILIERFAKLHPEQAARLVEHEPVGDALEVVAGLDPQTAAKVIERLTLPSGSGLITAFGAERAAPVVEAMEPGRAAAVVSRMAPKAREATLRALSPACRRDIDLLNSYPADSAGGLMDPLVTTMTPESTVDQALERVRKIIPRRVVDVFVVDREGVLRGVATIQAVATAAPGTTLAAIATRPVPRVRGTATREEVVEIADTHRLLSLPVVDYADRVVGVIRPDRLIETAEGEATMDIQTMVGVSRQERALSSPGFVVRRRLPWLQINLATAFVAAAVVGIFEETIARFTALAVLLPVVAGQSGNTGAQALAVIMRGLSLREITPRHAPRVLVKELTVAVLNGIAVAIVTGTGVLVWSGSIGLAAVTAVAMVISMAAAGLAGTAIPLVLQRLGQDPAQSSSIVLTTVTDVTGFFSFLGLATLFSTYL